MKTKLLGELLKRFRAYLGEMTQVYELRTKTPQARHESKGCVKGTRPKWSYHKEDMLKRRYGE